MGWIFYSIERVKSESNSQNIAVCRIGSQLIDSRLRDRPRVVPTRDVIVSHYPKMQLYASLFILITGLLSMCSLREVIFETPNRSIMARMFVLRLRGFAETTRHWTTRSGKVLKDQSPRELIGPASSIFTRLCQDDTSS